MSTRAHIILQDGDRYIRIYCHFDGYLQGLGKILTEYYDTFDKVKELVWLGDASSIEATLKESDFYHRDRNENWDDVRPTVYNDLVTALNATIKSWAEYVYVFQDGQWFWAECNEQVELKPLLHWRKT